MKALWRACLGLLLVVAPALALAARPAPPVLDEVLKLNGTLSVQVADDFRAHRASALYSLVVRPGYRVALRFRGTPPSGLRTGMKVEASGRFDGERLLVDADAGAFKVGDAAPAAAPASARKVLLVLTDIVDGSNNVHAVDQSCDAHETEGTADIMFGTKTTTQHVDGAYRESSFDALGMGGMAYPGTGLDVLRVQVHEAAMSLSGVCNYDDWANQADALVAAAGVGAGDFQHRVYVLPAAAGCGWGGLGELSCGVDCRAWEMTYDPYYLCGTRSAHAHELGHNLGFMHASSDFGNDGVDIDEYGDDSDFMGANQDPVQQTSAMHKSQLGWLGVNGVTDIGADGVFTVSPSESNPGAHPRLYRLAVANGLPYYFSYRVGVGYDANPNLAGYASRLNIHRWSGGPTNTYFISAPDTNDSFADASNSLMVALLAQGDDGATFRVTRGGSCVRNAPTVTISPSSITTTALPANGVYTISVRNNDSNSCPSSQFPFTGTASPFVTAISTGWARLAPGNSTSFTFTVSPNAAAANGTYAVSAGTSSETDHAGVLANASYIINVSPACVVRAPTGTMNPATQTTTQVPVNGVGFGAKIVNNDSGSSCTSSNFPLSVTVPAGWTESHSPSTLTLAALASGVSNINVNVPAGTPNGDYPIVVKTTAAGGHGAITFSGTVTVNVDPNACNRLSPQVMLNPSSYSTTTVPHTWTGTMTVSNQDSGGGCGSSSFQLGSYVAAGWTTSISPASVNLAAGGSADATVTFSAPADAAVGNYTLQAWTEADAVHSKSTQSVLVQVLGSSGTCTRHAPGVQLSPLSQDATALPATRTYAVIVTNYDSSECASSAFPVSGTVPAGWTGSVSPLRVTLAPGASGQLSFKVTAPAGTANASYAIAAATRADTNHASVAGSGSLVVNVAGGSCTVAAPTASLSPSTQTTTSLPKALAYTLTLTNKDSAACAGSSFPLATQVPSGWSGSISPSSLSLAPGASGTATFTATAPAGAANASFTVKAGTSAAGGHAAVLGSASAVVNVASGGDTTPPTTPSNLTGVLSGTQVVLNWNASTDAGGLANYRVYKNGALFASPTTNSLTKLVPRGTWTFYVTAVDKSGNVSGASNSVVVTR